MSLIDELRQSRESPATAFLQFLQNQKYGGLHAFMEGDADPSFYRVALLMYYPNSDSIYLYKCGGKKDVYRTREKISMHTETSAGRIFKLTVVYFVDKDLSDVLPEHFPQLPDVYVTDYYSIENYLVNRFLFDVILTDCFNFTRGAIPDKPRLLELFENSLREFHFQIIRIMAWAVFLKRNKYDIELSHVKLGKFFSIDSNLSVQFNVARKYAHYVAVLDEQCDVSTPPEYFNTEANLIAELQNYDPKRIVRGKFEIWFLLKFTEAVKVLLKSAPELEFRYSEALLAERDIVKFLGPRLQSPPANLMEFLAQNIPSMPQIES